MTSPRFIPAIENCEPRLLLSGTATYTEWTANPSYIGDTFEGATAIALSQTTGSMVMQGKITSATDTDMIQIAATQSGKMSISMKAINGTALDSRIDIFNNSRTLVGSSDNAVGKDARLTLNVTAGQTYYIKAIGANSSLGTYQIDVGTAITGELQGDANHDNRVDLADFTTLRNNLGERTSGTWNGGDFNVDGNIDLADFTVLRNNLGKTQTPPPTPPLPPPPTGKIPANATYIDRDGDGYGVNSPLGPDANDKDASVNTYNSMISKYGTVQNFVRQGLGYNPKRIFIGDPTSALQPGDMVILTGTHTGNYTYGISNVHGTTTDPIVYLAMPGQRVIMNANTEGLSIKNSSNIIVDGLELKGNGTGYGTVAIYTQNAVMRNINAYNYTLGFKGMQDMHNWVMENSVYHDSTSSHGAYFGSRDLPNSNITVRNNIFYGNSKTGFQHNGRVDNLVIENNIVHSNGIGGLSMLEGVSNSTIRNNVIFNNGTQGIIFYTYDDTNTGGIYPFNQVGNVIEGNTIWVGQYDSNGGTGTRLHSAIQFNDATAAGKYLINAAIRNNVLVTQSGPTLRMDQSRHAAGTSFTGNVIYRADGSGNIVQSGGTSYGFSSLSSLGSNYTGNTYKDPMFKNVSTSYYNTPEKFDFTRTA